MKVGFIGLGNMGSPMARNLLVEGFECHVYNRTCSRSQILQDEGAIVCHSVVELTRKSDLVLLCLSDLEACKEILLGKDGVFSAIGAGQLVVDHSTVDRELSLLCHLMASEKGAGFLDAPISGGPDGARTARLSMMAGGSQEDFKRCLPVFKAMARTVIRMGGPGAGTATKMANQLLVSIHNLAASEPILLCERMGVDLGKAAEILADSWGASRILLRNLPLIQERKFGPSQAPLRHLSKDLGFVVNEASKLGMDLPLSFLIQDLVRGVVEQDKGDWDISSMFQIYSE